VVTIYGVLVSYGARADCKSVVKSPLGSIPRCSTIFNSLQEKIMTCNIDSLTLGQIKELKAIFGSDASEKPKSHCMINRRCLIRTYSAGVHIGDIDYIDGMEVRLLNSLRLWKWEGGGLSLSAVANRGIKSGRLNKTGEIYLTNVIEIIPTTTLAESTYVKFIED
jgi:hypothetical protein